jgi:hypothetical protein
MQLFNIHLPRNLSSAPFARSRPSEAPDISLTAVALLERVFLLVDRDSGKWFVNVVCTRTSILASKKQLLRPIAGRPPMQMPPLLPAAKLLIPWIVEFDFLGRLAKKPTSPPHNEWRRRDKRGLVTRIWGFMIRVGVPGGEHTGNQYSLRLGIAVWMHTPQSAPFIAAFELAA